MFQRVMVDVPWVGTATTPEDIVFKLSQCGALSNSQNLTRSSFGAATCSIRSPVSVR